MELLSTTPEVPCRISRLRFHQLQGWLRAVAYTVDIRRVVFISQFWSQSSVLLTLLHGGVQGACATPPVARRFASASSSTGDSISSWCSDSKQLGRLPAIATPRFPACTAWRFESSQAYPCVLLCQDILKAHEQEHREAGQARQGSRCSPARLCRPASSIAHPDSNDPRSRREDKEDRAEHLEGLSTGTTKRESVIKHKATSSEGFQSSVSGQHDEHASSTAGSEPRLLHDRFSSENSLDRRSIGAYAQPHPRSSSPTLAGRTLLQQLREQPPIPNISPYVGAHYGIPDLPEPYPATEPWGVQALSATLSGAYSNLVLSEGTRPDGMIGDPLVSSYGSYQHNSRYDTSEDSKVSLGDLSSTPSSGSTFFHVGMCFVCAPSYVSPFPRAIGELKGQDIPRSLRLFIVVNLRNDSCLCFPIVTYNELPARKGKAIVYIQGEEERSDVYKYTGWFGAIKIIPSDDTFHLAQGSFIDFDSVQTVKYNTSVHELGSVTGQYLERVKSHFYQWRGLDDNSRRSPFYSRSIASHPTSVLDQSSSFYTGLGIPSQETTLAPLSKLYDEVTDTSQISWDEENETDSTTPDTSSRRNMFGGCSITEQSS